jgi:hypothetical protein
LALRGFGFSRGALSLAKAHRVMFFVRDDDFAVELAINALRRLFDDSA